MTLIQQLLERIAAEHLLIPTLDCRNSDGLDFHTVSVWAVKAALKSAFEAGCQSTNHNQGEPL